jgi:hypothetical protein
MRWWLECSKTIERASTPSPSRAPSLEFTSRIDAPRPCRTPSRGGVLLVYLLKAICVKVFIGGVTCSVEVCPEHVAARLWVETDVCGASQNQPFPFCGIIWLCASILKAKLLGLGFGITSTRVARQKLSPRTLKIAVPPRCATTERMNPH